MSDRVTVIWDDLLAGYNFGPGHPLAPIRQELTIALARELGVLDAPAVRVVGGLQPADDELLATVHASAYLEAVRDAGDPMLPRPRMEFGLGTADNPVFPGMHGAAALVVAATVAAADDVWAGRAQHGVNVAGGLHHAMPAAASGFCVYNDPAIAIRRLLAAGAQRVAYVDIDVHHGDGVQAVFAADPRVLTISVHESGRTLFPGTGFPTETGVAGTSVNVALPAGTTDAGWLRALHAVVPPLVRAFGPDVLVSQHGCDTHMLDPLAHLLVSVDGQRAAHAAVHALAHEVCDGRWVAVGGGGYELVQVVPRSWAFLLAEAAGVPLAPDTETPPAWRELALRQAREVPPTRLGDGRDPRYTPYPEPDASVPAEVDAAIAATRAAVFAHHGLAP